MRFWPRRRTAPAPAPSDGLILLGDILRRNVDDILAVYDNGEKNGVFLFRGQLVTTPARALEILRDRFRRVGYTPYLRADRGGVLVQAWPSAGVEDRSRVTLNVVLFVLTVVSTLLAGTQFVGSPTFDALRRAPSWWWLLSGVPFAVTLLLTLGVHEFGHYLTARHYGVSVSLPYFIPVPPPFLFGTLGAVIRMRSPARDRNALFDIAAAGPIAGLVIALPALILGIHWSAVAPVAPGTWVTFGDSALTHALVALRFGVIPEGMKLYTHPVFDAAWVGLLVTALNLMPVGQLDGGRIAYALFGTRHRMVGIATFLALLALGALTWSVNWVVWGFFVLFFIGFHHGPPLDDLTPLTPGRRAVGVACLLLLVLLVPPIPIDVG
ncbi:MAG: site-2 protease family protein [Candidatus Rokubacteria bacterium]|nr:site-2 protease family protein [Candidatus Rokubacteria bacterium]